MRFLPKPARQPVLILDFIDGQMAARERAEDPHVWEAFPVHYEQLDSAPVLALLMQDQQGLCGYTCMAVDDRLQARQPRNLQPPRGDFWYVAHIEHLKPRSQCRRDLEEAGGIWGRDVAEDIDYKNMIAAVGVGVKKSARVEQFGVVLRKNDPLPVLPTEVGCEQRFRYLANGTVVGMDKGAQEAVNLLALNHRTLREWRLAQIEAFLPLEEEAAPREYVELVLSLMTEPRNGRLPEFCVAVKAVAELLLGPA